MAKRPLSFDAFDEKIMRTLYAEAIPMTIGEISKKTLISWATVKTHIEKLVLLGLVEEVQTATRTTPKVMWNFEKYGNAAGMMA